MVAIIGAFTYAIVQTMMQARVRELEIRERIAMIERGLVPPPEVDPRGFERAMNRYERVAVWPGTLASTSAGRHRRAGITLIGVGLGLMLLISVAGETPDGRRRRRRVPVHPRPRVPREQLLRTAAGAAAGRLGAGRRTAPRHAPPRRVPASRPPASERLYRQVPPPPS